MLKELTHAYKEGTLAEVDVYNIFQTQPHPFSR
jgi:hypothetical protein